MPKKYKLKNGETKWEFNVYLGVNPKTNKKSNTTRRGFKTRSEALKEMRRIEYEVANNTYWEDRKSKEYTFKEVYEMWLSEYKNTVAESTLYKMEGDFNNRILPELETYLIDKIDHKDIQKIANKWSEYVNNRKWISFISRIFRYAQKHNYASNDPTVHVTIPKVKKEDKKLFYEKDELNKIVEVLNEDDNLQRKLFLRLLIFTGIRRGEALALHWEDVSYIKKTININKGVRRNSKGLYIGGPKNESSNRIISIDDQTINILKEWQKFKINERVFYSQSGKILSTSIPRKWLLETAKKAEVEFINLHGLRHTHTSLLIDAGASIKEIQYRLGHSKIDTTLNIYSHLTKESKENFAEKFNNFLKDSQKDSQKPPND